ncbi:MAG: 5-(carboxyamino)imidazole ribonucleotide synthase [Planctomycetaceae bacterium]
MTTPILPGATLGVLGSGQLGRMFAIAARRLGYRVHVLSPDTDTPTGQVADVEIHAEYDDADAVTSFVRGVDVVTFEFENVPSTATEIAAKFVPVRPGGDILHIAQHRAREKTFLRQHGFPTAPFSIAGTFEELQQAIARIGCPAVLKTAGFGYDGKGQMVLRSPDQAAAGWQQLGSSDVVLEGLIDFDCEVSVIVVRGVDGELATYGPIRNAHANHILDLSTVPAGLPQPLSDEAIAMSRAIAESLNLVGVLCVEMFVTRGNQLLVNELAPRPHNSGHLTIDAHVTCQFEQQVRAVCGLPLGSTRQHTPAAMANLLGDAWRHGTPRWAAAAALPEVKLHLYGKQKARPGRKMGHITALGETIEAAEQLARTARNHLTGEP